MIVVGIIGILVSLTGPMYTRYQAKAHQAEVKVALGAIYSLEKSFYSEYGAYIADFDAIGYSPEGQKRFYSVGWSAVSGAGMVSGFTGSPGNFFYDRINYPAAWTSATCADIDTPTAGGWLTTTPAAATQDSQSFVVHGYGIIKNSGQCDGWTMTDLKILANGSSGY